MKGKCVFRTPSLLLCHSYPLFSEERRGVLISFLLSYRGKKSQDKYERERERVFGVHSYIISDVFMHIFVVIEEKEKGGIKW